MDVFEKTKNYVMDTYARLPVSFVRGSGCWLYDEKGKKYLDMLAGIAVCNLGHSHPEVRERVCDQLGNLVHVSNLFYIEPQAELAKLLCENSFGERVFFCNSGAEAIEGAIKIVRRYGLSKHPEKFEIIAFRNSFHGRTSGALSLTGKEIYREGFGPLLPGIRFAEFNDIGSVLSVISEKTAGIVVEPVQGEGGIVPAEPEFLKALRELADEFDALLVFDEIQTGLGRTGKLFAYEHYEVEPDVMTLAKALGNGIPIGAIVAGRKAMDVLSRGLHASTFGGNPVATSAGIVVMRNLLKEGFLGEVEEKGRYMIGRLEEIARRVPFIESVRGKGLMIGVVCTRECGDIVLKALERGLVLNCTADNVLRLTPPLIISREEIDTGLSILEDVLTGHEA